MTTVALIKSATNISHHIVDLLVLFIYKLHAALLAVCILLVRGDHCLGDD